MVIYLDAGPVRSRNCYNNTLTEKSFNFCEVGAEISMSNGLKEDSAKLLQDELDKVLESVFSAYLSLERARNFLRSLPHPVDKTKDNLHLVCTEIGEKSGSGDS